MKGRAIYAGAADTSGTPSGTFAGSVIDNVRLEFDGFGPTVPAFDITSNGSAEGSNNLSLLNVRLYQSFGTGLWIHTNSTQNASGIRILNLTIEGSLVSQTNLGGDLIELGDPATTAYSVSNLVARNVSLSNPLLGFAALHVAGGTGSTLPNGIDVDATIFASGGNLGRGLQVETCMQCGFKFARNLSLDYIC